MANQSQCEGCRYIDGPRCDVRTASEGFIEFLNDHNFGHEPSIQLIEIGWKQINDGAECPFRKDD